MRQLSKIKAVAFVGTLVSVMIAAGCSSAPLRTEASTSGIRAAEEVGATNVPKASLYLKLAKEELELAQSLAKKGEREQAASMLLRSEADSQLAIALSREDTERTEAQAAEARVRQLRQDNNLPNE
jgi:hypothetical protein